LVVEYVITEFTPEMAESVHLNSLDEDNRRFIPDEVFETVGDALDTIAELMTLYGKLDAPLVYPILLKSGEQIGHVQSVPIPNGWEIGYHIGKAYTSNGYATEAVTAFLPYIMEQLGITEIAGICRADNYASHRILEKCGFGLEFDSLATNPPQKRLYHGEQHDIRVYRYVAERYNIISVRNNNRYLKRAVDYFASKWSVYRAVYDDSIRHSISTSSPLPRWYLMLDENERIVGSYGLITNDFNSRQDLYPWLAALFIEESERDQQLGSMLLAHATAEARNLGFENIYLETSHVGYYEKYGWKHIGSCYGASGNEHRLYQISCEQYQRRQPKCPEHLLMTSQTI
jgi:RimJ/RimL family protein N-acetyltransferase/N-acetylglutamate synthase-like GNAT family acetyltransferase